MTGSCESSLRITISDATMPPSVDATMPPSVDATMDRPAPTRPDRTAPDEPRNVRTGPDRTAPDRTAPDEPRNVRTTVMTLRGNLDIDSAASLRATLDGLLGTAGCRIVVDLGGLDFCDSIGLSALVDAHRAGERGGGYLRLAAPSPFLSRILAVVGLIGKLAVYESVAAALADDPPGGRPTPTDPGPRH